MHLSRERQDNVTKKRHSRPIMTKDNAMAYDAEFPHNNLTESRDNSPMDSDGQDNISGHNDRVVKELFALQSREIAPKTPEKTTEGERKKYLYNLDFRCPFGDKGLQCRYADRLSGSCR